MQETSNNLPMSLEIGSILSHLTFSKHYFMFHCFVACAVNKKFSDERRLKIGRRGDILPLPIKYYTLLIKNASISVRL